MTTAARAAALAVCTLARDTADAALLLDALGLVKDGALAWPENPVLPIIHTTGDVLPARGLTWRGYEG